MNRFIVLFDASPINEPTPWMRMAAEQADLSFILQDDIARTISEDPKARQTLPQMNTTGADVRLAPFYQAALEKLAKDKPRIALHSATWTLYGIKPDALIYSFDQMQDERAKAHKMGMSDQNYDHFVEEAKKKVRVFFKGVPPERMLEVSGTKEQKAASAVAFIKKQPPKR